MAAITHAAAAGDRAFSIPSGIAPTKVTVNGVNTPFTFNAGTVWLNAAVTQNARVEITYVENTDEAWIAWEPVLTPTGGADVALTSVACAYRLVGKTLFFRISVAVTYTTAPTQLSFALPLGLSSPGRQPVPGLNANRGALLYGAAFQGNITVNPQLNASGQFLAISAAVEVV